MDELLIFFAFPIATIIISIVLQRTLRCAFLVAATIFAIFLIVTFTAFDATFLIATLAYTILAFVTALVTQYLINCREDNANNNASNNTGNGGSSCCRCGRR